MIKTNFNEYKSILETELVTVHTLSQYFSRKDIDFDEHGNVFIGFNDKTNGLPILVAHTDNVLHGQRVPVFDLNKRMLFGKGAGIGFDDKAGIIAIIQLWRHFKDKQMFRIIFTAQEEIGGIGAQNMDQSWYDDAPWIVELDRRGHKDLIQTSGSTRLCSDAFAAKFEELGFEKAQGTFTDVNELKLNTPWINMVNLSIGYYDAHSDREYLDTKQFDEIVNKVAEFVKAEYTFEDDVPDPEPKYNNYNSQFGNWKNDYCWTCGKLTSNPAKSTGERFCCKDCEDEYFDSMK